MKKLCLLLLVIIAASLSCNSASTPAKAAYTTYTAAKGLARFSFEYPADYKVMSFETNPESSVLTLTGPAVKGTPYTAALTVTIRTTDSYIPDAESAFLMTLLDAKNEQDFKLLEQSYVQVAGIQAQLLRFSVRNPTSAGATENRTDVFSEAYFDYHDFVWNIETISDSSTAGTDKAVFDRILQTFKILP
jgi:hypothetical protein